ncbi:MAG: DUF3576 domain-containing protein [Pseudomonadota bacterium]
MRAQAIIRSVMGITALSLIAACGNSTFLGQTREERIAANRASLDRSLGERNAQGERQSSLFDLFDNRDDPNTTLEVNKYLWAASLDVLSFMPVQNADPFSGVIQFGFGTPPGGGRAYQATVFIQDPALDARSLNVALRTRGGAASRETQRAIEDAILTRARQLRIRDSRL